MWGSLRSPNKGHEPMCGIKDVHLHNHKLYVANVHVRIHVHVSMNFQLQHNYAIIIATGELNGTKKCTRWLQTRLCRRSQG